MPSGTTGTSSTPPAPSPDLLDLLPPEVLVRAPDGTVVQGEPVDVPGREFVLADGFVCRWPAAPRRDPADVLAASLAAADALARTLNVRRTLRRLADLAVPRFGEAATVVAVLDGEVRSARSGRATSGQQPLRTEMAAEMKAEMKAEMVTDVAAAPPSQRLLRSDDAVLADFGLADPEPSGLVVLTTVPVHDPLTGLGGVLAVRSVPATAPDPADVAALGARGSVAVSAARVFEQRAALADRLRAALLPAPLPRIPGVQLGASYRPAREAAQLGGDFYDVFPAGDGGWSVSIGDVCGKGVDAAVLTGQVRQSLRTACRVTDDPAEILRLVNDTLLTGDGSTFVTVLLGTLRSPTGAGLDLRLAAGGHPPPLLLRGDQVEVVEARGTIVGMLDDVSFASVDLHLDPGDTLLMFTDGVLEAPGRGDSQLGVVRVADLLADCEGLTAQAVTERVLQLVVEYTAQAGSDATPDDVAVLALRAEPVA